MSDLRIFGQVGVGLSVGSAEIPLAMGGVKEVLITQNVKAFVPQLKITVYDLDGTLHYASPVDGTRINVTLDDGANGGQEYGFRLFGGPQIQDVGSALQFTMSGMLDAVKFLREHVTKAHYMKNASDVVASVASEVGFSPDIIAQTNDMMTWLPQPVSFAKFTQYVTQHAYKDASSFMAWAVTEARKMKFVDITEQSRKSGVANFFNALPPSGSGRPIKILHWEVLSQGGVANHMFNYGTKIIEEKMEGLASVFHKIKIPAMNGVLGMAKDLVSGIDTVKNAYVPPDTGNTHKNFMQAKFQNLRHESTFVGSMEVITDQITGVELYDPVETTITVPHLNRISEIYSSKFIVTAKTRCMRGPNNYYEKLLLSSQGFSSPDAAS